MSARILWNRVGPLARHCLVWLALTAASVVALDGARRVGASDPKTALGTAGESMRMAGKRACRSCQAQ